MSDLEHLPGSPAPEPARRNGLARLLWPLVAAGGVLLKLAGSLKFLGIFISVGGYALIWGWPFAVGFVLLILVHEAGHYFEAKRQGLKPGLPVFIPFFGAYVAFKDQPFDPWRNALVSIAGPIAGGLGALACLVYAEATDERFWFALAYTGFFLNAINLVAIGFFDGGHVLRAWRVLHHGGGHASPAEARRRGVMVAVISLGTLAALVVGMLYAHIPQSRL